MKEKAERYYRSILGDSPPFARWPFAEIRASENAWKIRTSTVFVFISALESRLGNVEVHSGAMMRGRRKISKRARPRRVLFFIELPPYRNFSARTVKEAIQSERTLIDKCDRGAKFAADRCLGFCVVPEIAEILRARGARIGEREVLRRRDDASIS